MSKTAFIFGIPCVGFGPAPESVGHTVNDSVPINQLVQAAAFYATFPNIYCGLNSEGSNEAKPPRRQDVKKR